MDKLIALSLRSIVCILNNEEIKANDYKIKALEIYEKKNQRHKHSYKIEDQVPKVVKNKLYELVG